MKKLGVFLLCLFGTGAFAQNSSAALFILKNELDSSFIEQKQRVNQYLSIHRVPVRFNDFEGNTIELVDVSEEGKPIYISTLNAGLALSTGVTKLRSDGTLGLNLVGKDITVGIWDGGPAFQHIEFGDRNLFTEGGTISDHGTHVTGTVLASGISTAAGGMAPSSKFYSYEWGSDRSEMVALAKPDETGLLFSNHSYGLVQGWVFQNNSWTWTGTPSISTIEDWRFGFYTSVARDLDQIAFNAPYYSIFWAAGNDRDDSGGTLYPADGNQGSGYDCLGQEGTAKNIFTIGAIQKFTEYTGGENIKMSGFSGWGPTDDGRIKPDLVAPGVGILSTIAGNNYAAYSGTSMASPGAMGSLVLLQELHKKMNGGKPMPSATLKALAIHTAKEAGQFPGPDYSYGWGVVDSEAAAKVLLEEDNLSTVVEEIQLEQGDVFELEIKPKSNARITATIAWTDPAGAVSAASLDPTTLILVNDLDIRIVKGNEEVGLPWALDPRDANLGQPAFRADNFRDNVEKVEYVAPEESSYVIRVTHKNQLAGGKQNFSLVLTYESIVPRLTDFYWVGGSGEWSDATHWSGISGGTGGLGVPNETSKIIVDENSLDAGDVISISADLKIGSLLWLNSAETSLECNSKTISVEKDFVIAEKGLSVTSAGKIIFTNSSNFKRSISFANNDFSNAALMFTGESLFDVKGAVQIDSLIIGGGKLQIKTDTIHVAVVSMSNGSEVDVSGLVFNNVKKLIVEPGVSLTSDDAEIVVSESASLDFGNSEFNGEVKINGGNVARISGNNKIKSLSISGELFIEGNNELEDLHMLGKSSLTMAALSTQRIKNLQLSSSATDRIQIRGNSGVASIQLLERMKLCFDYLDITNVQIAGDAVVNAGLNSVLINSANWESDVCENVLFPDFSFDVNCVGSLIAILDVSQGLISKRVWSVSESMELYETPEGKTYLIGSEKGIFEISLSIQNSKSSKSLTKSIEIVDNDLGTNRVSINGDNLFSHSASSSYQWFKDFQPIADAKGRTYDFNGVPGLYFVLTQSEACNRISSEVLISESEYNNLDAGKGLFWPNPVENFLHMDTEVIEAFEILDTAGIVLITSSNKSFDSVIDVRSLSSGMYIIQLRTKSGNTIRQKIIVK